MRLGLISLQCTTVLEHWCPIRFHPRFCRLLCAERCTLESSLLYKTKCFFFPTSHEMTLHSTFIAGFVFGVHFSCFTRAWGFVPQWIMISPLNRPRIKHNNAMTFLEPALVSTISLSPASVSKQQAHSKILPISSLSGTGEWWNFIYWWVHLQVEDLKGLAGSQSFPTICAFSNYIINLVISVLLRHLWKVKQHVY